MRTKFSIFGLLFVVFCVFSAGYADVPQMINYQGKITTSAGALVDTTVQMIFTIYDDSTSGTIFWADTIGSVSVQKGIFSVLLGSGNPLPDSVFDGNIRYLGTKVGTDAEMSPRKAMVSVAYAYRAGTADGGGGADNDWTFRITDTADTTLITGGRWGIARYGNVLYGNADSTHVNLGVACTSGESGQNHRYCTVGGGRVNTASGQMTTVGGGSENTASAGSATVGGGSENTASAGGATIGGGYSNTASDDYATIGGGFENTASGNFATVGAGQDNTASGDYATVPGGFDNAAAGDYSLAAGLGVNIDAAGDYTFAFGRGFSTSTPNAVIFHNSIDPIKVGIGTPSPGADLDIVSTNPNLRVGTTSGSPVITLDKGAGNWGYLEFREGGASKWQAGVTTDNNYYILNWPASKYVFYANSAGNVGIGTTSPDEELHVVGNIKMIDGNQAAGYVLTSDANGVGTWQAPAGGGGWVDDGTVVRLETSTDNVGIGTASPGANLDIVSTNPSLRLGTASGSPVITLDKASGNWGYLEFREGGASKWQAGVTTGNSYYILNWPSSKYVFYANSAGDVGIGTTSPSEKLTVNGDIDMIQGQSRIHGAGEISFDWSAGSTYDNSSQHGFESKDEAGTWGDEIRINSMNDIINTVDANDNDATSYFKVQHHSTGDGEDLFWVRSSDGYAYHKGRLGIGTNSPGVDLDILSTNPNLRLSTASGSPVITLDKGSGYWGYLEFRDGGASKWQAGVTSSNNYYILNWPASRYVFYANSAGNVGMGTTSPTGPLDVNGNDIRIRTSQTPASASADGYTGEIAWDANYIYICTSGDGPGGGTDSWKRAALSTW